MGRIKESLKRLDIEGGFGKIDCRFLRIMREYKQLRAIYIIKKENIDTDVVSQDNRIY